MKSIPPNSLVNLASSHSFIGALIFSLVLTAYLFQNFVALNHDVAWLLLVAERFLAGQTLYTDVVIVNPPLIIYFNSIAIALAKLSGVSPIFCVRLLMTALTVFTLILSNFLLDKLFDGKHQRTRLYTIFALGFGLMFFGVSSFAQREHISITLYIPYIIAGALFLQNKKPNITLRVSIAILGALGVALKPQLVLMLIFTELYMLVASRAISTPFRIESITVAIVGFGYILFTYIFHNEYFSFAIPLAVDFYNNWKKPLIEVFMIYHPILILLTPLALLAFKSKPVPLQLFSLMALSAMGAFLAHLQQGQPWGYHSLPFDVLASAIILVGFFTFLVRKRVLTPNFKIPHQKLNGLIGLLFFPALLLPLIYKPLIHDFRDLINSDSELLSNRLLPSKRQVEFQKFISPIPEARSVFMFGTSIYYIFPTVTYGNYDYTSRFPSLWFLKKIAAVRNNPSKYSSAELQRIDEVEAYMFDTIIEDLKNNPPDLIVVDISEKKSNFGDMEFDHLQYFSQDERFRNFLSNYNYHSDFEYGKKIGQPYSLYVKKELL